MGALSPGVGAFSSSGGGEESEVFFSPLVDAIFDSLPSTYLLYCSKGRIRGAKYSCREVDVNGESKRAKCELLQRREEINADCTQHARQAKKNNSSGTDGTFSTCGFGRFAMFPPTLFT